MLKYVILKLLENLSISGAYFRLFLRVPGTVANCDMEVLALFPCKNKRELFLLCPQEKNPKMQIDTH